MNRNLNILNEENFDKQTSKGNWIIDFWASWCPPCRALGPIFESTTGEYKKAKFGKVDVDSNKEISRRFNVMSIPTMIFIKNGKEVMRSVGLVSKNTIVKNADSVF